MMSLLEEIMIYFMDQLAIFSSFLNDCCLRWLRYRIVSWKKLKPSEQQLQPERCGRPDMVRSVRLLLVKGQATLVL